jgi:hypothetical protein
MAGKFTLMNSETGKILIWTGAILLGCGLLIYFFHDKLTWIGRLPGDIRIERGNTKIYFPITTMILFSLILSVIIRLIRKF